jgi:hypothetical protein
MAKPRSQRELAQTLLKKQGIMRLIELREAGVTAATMSRMERTGEVTRLSRGVYQLPDADLDPNHSLAEAAKRVPIRERNEIQSRARSPGWSRHLSPFSGRRWSVCEGDSPKSLL